MNDELVSIIVPNYNYERTIGLCLDAIYQQTYPNFEVLVVDDGSTDGSMAIVRNYDCQLLHTPSNGGVAIARNLGAKAAQGSVLFFVDSDIALEPDAVANAIAAFAGDTTIGSVCGIYAKTPLIRDSLLEEYRSLQAHYWRKSSEGFVTPGFFSLGAIRKSVFEEIGEFNPKLTQTEEVEYGHRLSKKYKLLLTSTVMGQHDDDDQFFKLSRKLFERARQRVPLYLKRRKFMRGFETPSRAAGVPFALLAVVTLLIGLVRPRFLLASASSAAVFLATDAGQYIFVRRERGLVFTIYFAVVHLLINAVIGTGLFKGVFDWAIHKEFRDRYLLS